MAGQQKRDPGQGYTRDRRSRDLALLPSDGTGPCGQHVDPTAASPPGEAFRRYSPCVEGILTWLPAAVKIYQARSERNRAPLGDAKARKRDHGRPESRPLLVAHTGFEPVISSLRGRCPRPLDECAKSVLFSTAVIIAALFPQVNSLYSFAGP